MLTVFGARSRIIMSGNFKQRLNSQRFACFAGGSWKIDLYQVQRHDAKLAAARTDQKNFRHYRIVNALADVLSRTVSAHRVANGSCNVDGCGGYFQIGGRALGSAQEHHRHKRQGCGAGWYPARRLVTAVPQVVNAPDHKRTHRLDRAPGLLPELYRHVGPRRTAPG